MTRDTSSAGGSGCLLMTGSIAAALGGVVTLSETPAVGITLLALATAGFGWGHHRQQQEKRRIEEEARRRAAERAGRAQDRRNRRAQRRRYADDAVTTASPLPRPWHARSQLAETAVAEYEHAVAQLAPGPTRERLLDALSTVRGVGRFCEDLARQATELERRLRPNPRWRPRGVQAGPQEERARAGLQRRLEEVTRNSTSGSTACAAWRCAAPTCWPCRRWPPATTIAATRWRCSIRSMGWSPPCSSCARPPPEQARGLPSAG